MVDKYCSSCIKYLGNIMMLYKKIEESLLDNTRKDLLTDKMKDYLVCIAKIEEENLVARLGEIANGLGVKSPSAHVMVKTLADRGMLKYKKHGYIVLTKKGREIALHLRNKADTIRNFLIKHLGVDGKIAAADANKIKNSLSDSTFKKLTNLIYFLENDLAHKGQLSSKSRRFLSNIKA